MIEIRELSETTVDQAMQLVTESFDLDVRRGWRSEDFEEDWMLAYHKFRSVAAGWPFVGLVGYQNYNQPVAISLVIRSAAYGESTGLWEWFFVSPRVKKTAFPLRLGRETIDRARLAGAKDFVAFVGHGNEPVERIMRMVGMKPIEVEYRGALHQLKHNVLRKHKLEAVKNNGK